MRRSEKLYLAASLGLGETGERLMQDHESHFAVQALLAMLMSIVDTGHRHLSVEEMAEFISLVRDRLSFLETHLDEPIFDSSSFVPNDGGHH